MSDIFVERAIHHLLLKSSLSNDYGLLTGKIGIAIAFFEYAKYTSNTIYSDFANDLLDGYLNHVSNLSTSFVSGLSGIGWGIEYLVQRKFMSFSTDLVCSQLDDKIMLFDIRRITDLSLNGIEGLLHYILIRIQGNMLQGFDIPFDQYYFACLSDRLMELNKNAISSNLCMLMSEFLNYMKCGELNYELDILRFLDFSHFSDLNFIDINLGLDNGLAGYILNVINEN